MSHLLDNLLIFGRVLRHAGIDVHHGRLLDVVEALGHVDLGARDEVYHTCRALLVHRQDEIAIFDRAFAAFWREHQTQTPTDRRREESRASAVEIEEVLAPDELNGPAGADRPPSAGAAGGDRPHGPARGRGREVASVAMPERTDPLRARTFTLLLVGICG